jgi:DnaB-like helicase N terminal domain
MPKDTPPIVAVKTGSTLAADELPPHDDEAEAGALACVLTADASEAAAMLDKLALDSFYDVRHREIYVALRSLRADAKPLDPVSLIQRLKDKGKLGDAGGLEYLTTLPDQTPSPANLPTYLDTLQDRATRRAAVRDAGELSRLATDTTITAAALADASRRMLEAHSRNGYADLRDLLVARAFDPTIEPPPLRAIFTLTGITISTPANLTTITSAIKTGKSAVIGAMAAAAMPHSQDADLLGFSSSNPKDMALLWFDSEQSPDDFWHCVYRALKRAGLPEPPPWLHAYCLTGLGCKRAWECVTEATKAAAVLHGGIHSTLIDGLADLVADVNDPEESNGFVAELHHMAIKYACPIIGVIHFNPGSEKSRGHLGSQVERKAETNLTLEKDAEETTVIYSTKNRRAGIPKNLGPRFAFSPDAGMHVSVASRQSVADKEELERLAMLADDLFADHPAMRYTELVSTVKRKLKLQDRTAERRVSLMSRLGVIKKSVAGLWTIGT